MEPEEELLDPGAGSGKNDSSTSSESSLCSLLWMLEERSNRSLGLSTCDMTLARLRSSCSSNELS